MSSGKRRAATVAVAQPVRVGFDLTAMVRLCCVVADAVPTVF